MLHQALDELRRTLQNTQVDEDIVAGLHATKTQYRCIVHGDTDAFISINKQGNLAWKWLTEWEGTQTVGLMIAGNIGRPGGSCVEPHRHVRGKIFFKTKPKAKTQEESALSCLFEMHNGQYKHDLIQFLSAASEKYRLPPAKGTEADFLVTDANGKKVDARDAGAELYSREYGTSLWAHNRPQIYVSFVAGPNANGKPGDVHKPRRSEELDSMYRTLSITAMQSYEFFEAMVRAAVKASLYSMLETKGVKRAIIAPVSCGLYAGEYEDAICSEYPLLCLRVLRELYTECKTSFDEVMIPEVMDHTEWVVNEGTACDFIDFPSAVFLLYYRQNTFLLLEQFGELIDNPDVWIWWAFPTEHGDAEECGLFSLNGGTTSVTVQTAPQLLRLVDENESISSHWPAFMLLLITALPTKGGAKAVFKDKSHQTRIRNFVTFWTSVLKKMRLLESDHWLSNALRELNNAFS